MVILDSTTVHLCNQSFHNTYYHPDPSYSYQCQPNSSFTANNKSLSVAHANSTNRNSFFTDLTTLIFRQVQKNIPQKVRILHLPCFKIFTTMSSSATSSSPEVEYSELDTKEGKAWNAACSPEIYDEGYIALGSTRGVFARSYLTYYNRIKSFPIRDDDVWIVSFPKTGKTCKKNFLKIRMSIIPNFLNWDNTTLSQCSFRNNMDSRNGLVYNERFGFPRSKIGYGETVGIHVNSSLITKN